MTEILEIVDSTTIKIRGMELTGQELKHHLANGLRWEELSEQLNKAGVSHD